MGVVTLSVWRRSSIEGRFSGLADNPGVDSVLRHAEKRHGVERFGQCKLVAATCTGSALNTALNSNQSLSALFIHLSLLTYYIKSRCMLIILLVLSACPRPISCQLLYPFWHCPHSTPTTVYVTVRCPSVRPSVPSFDSSNGVWRVAAERSAGRRYRPIAAGTLWG